tara:strand:+ start:176 stop:664 length:489 start_codon:yes stop_codon:yes gene_type:complete
MAADKAIVSITASLLPDEIKTSIGGTTVYNLNDFGDNNLWLYTLTLIGASSEDLIKTGTNYLGQGTSEEGATGTTQGTDDVLFVFVKHSGTTDGSTATTANLHINLDGGTATGSLKGDIVIAPNECWFGRMGTDTKIQDINADSSSGVIQTQVFAICDDGGV